MLEYHGANQNSSHGLSNLCPCQSGPRSSPSPPQLGVVAVNQATLAVGNRAKGIHHHEGGDIGRTNLSIGSSLTRVGKASKIAYLHGHPASALCPMLPREVHVENERYRADLAEAPI